MAAELEAELGKLAPVKTRRPRRELAVLVGISLIYGASLVGFLSLRDDMAELPLGWLAGGAIAWVLGFVVPAYVALVPPAGRVTPRWQPGAIAVVVASVGFVALGLAVHPMGPSSVSYGWERLGRGHPCLELGLATALVPVVMGALFLRRALPVGSRWVAAALGAGGGCVGGLVLHLHCHVADGPHIGVVHGGVVIVSALLSAAIVPRAIEPR
jgi:hypothetical protein